MAGTLRAQDAGPRAHDPAGTASPRPGTVAAGVVAVLILGGGGAVALLGGDGAPPGPMPARPAPTPAVSFPPSPELPEALRTADDGPGTAVEPLLVAPNAEWRLFAGVPVPFSSTAGPRVADGPIVRGYERSQVGALIAAQQLGTRYLLTPGDGWRQVLQEQVLPGVGRDVFARNRAAVDAEDPPGSYGQPAGFRFVAYTGDVASIQLVSRFPSTGTLQVVAVTVRWVDGDWRLQLQPDGGSSPTAQAVADLDGFVPWGI